MSPLWASNSASFLRSSASSRLTWKDSERRGTSLGHLVAVVFVDRALAEECVPLGLVDDDLQAKNFDVVPDLRLELEQLLPGFVMGVPVDGALHQLDDGSGQIGLGHRMPLPWVPVPRVNVTRGSVAVRRWPSGPVQLICSALASS